MAKVTLEIVGMYLKETVEVPLTGGVATVESVLDAAVAALDQAKGNIRLRYTSEGRQMDTFTVTHRAKPVSRSGRTYPEGIYTFSDPEYKGNPNGVPVWQYYVTDASGIPQSQDDQFIPFKDAEFPFEDGWTLKWRCVLIFTVPAKPLSLKLTPGNTDGWSSSA